MSAETWASIVGANVLSYGEIMVGIDPYLPDVPAAFEQNNGGTDWLPRHLDFVLETTIGEIGFRDSPFEVSNVDFTGKSIVQRTGAGTQGIVAALHAERLYATSLVTASATARALLSSASGRISLVALGNKGRRGDAHAVRHVILAGGDALRFHDPSRPHLDRHDLDIALDVDRYIVGGLGGRLSVTR